MELQELITSEEWDQTPYAVQMLVQSLWQQVTVQEAEVNTLKERLGQTSRNSSRPPSSDPQGALKQKRPPSGRRPGGQPGHEGTSRTLIPVTAVKAVIPVKPSACAQCGHPLGGEDPTPRRHQVTEIPPLVAETTASQLHTLTCADCGAQTRAELPAGVPQGTFGPRVQAMVATLSGEDHLSKRQIEALLADFFRVELGLGTVSALEQATSAIRDGPVAEAQVAVTAQPEANVDETGWQESHRRAWLKVAVTQVATVFLRRLSRGAKVAKALLGEADRGGVGSDRWSGYNGIANERRHGSAVRNPARRDLLGSPVAGF